MSASLFLFLRIKKSTIGAMKPKINEVKIVTVLFNGSASNVKAKTVKTIIVNEGGTKSVEIKRANLLAKSFVMLNLFQHLG